MRQGETGLLQCLLVLREIFRHKWVPDVLVALQNGPLRRTELLQAIREAAAASSCARGTIDDSVLSYTLERLEKHALVLSEKVLQAQPENRKAVYQLTPQARSLLTVVLPATDWAAEHLIAIQEKQRLAIRPELR